VQSGFEDTHILPYETDPSHPLNSLQYLYISHSVRDFFLHVVHSRVSWSAHWAIRHVPLQRNYRSHVLFHRVSDCTCWCILAQNGWQLSMRIVHYLVFWRLNFIYFHSSIYTLLPILSFKLLVYEYAFCRRRPSRKHS